jgi:hypothetical protein
MSKKKKEKVEEPEVQEKVIEQKEENVIDLGKFATKDDPSVVKVDLSAPPPTDDVKEEVVEEQVVAEETQPEAVDENQTSLIEEITEVEQQQADELGEEAVEAIQASEESGAVIPEKIQKLLDFMDDTGGDLEDYVRLNKNVDELDSKDVLQDYYKATKPHLSSDEIDFLMEDKFSFDEDIEDETQIKRKKLALKEQVAEAKTYLDGQKSKYYEEIKAGSKLTQEQQKAIDFFNRYSKETEQSNKTAELNKTRFDKKTNEVFNDEFKGFEYNVGDKRFRFNVKDAGQVKENQSDIGNFIKKFLNEDKSINDAKGYHKGLYTAMNADAVAQHFYEQGKTDALKDSVAKAKNINTTARSSHEEGQTGGMKVRVLNDDSASFKFKIKNKNKN